MRLFDLNRGISAREKGSLPDSLAMTSSVVMLTAEEPMSGSMTSLSDCDPFLALQILRLSGGWLPHLCHLEVRPLGSQ